MNVVRYDVWLELSFERDPESLIRDILLNIQSLLTIQYFPIELIHLL
jgi:hypothetical protein